MKNNMIRVLVLCLFVMLCAGAVSALTSGPRNAGTGADVTGVGTKTWSHHEYIVTTGSPYATASNVPEDGGATHYLKGTNYGFAIPSGATINGIIVTINRRSSGQDSPFLRDSIVKLVKAGTITGDNKAATGTNWPTSSSPETATYGSSSDSWGIAWTPEDINAANFGVVLSATNPNTHHDRDATVDYMQMTVYYCTPTAETCDGLDNDCDGLIDEDLTAPLCENQLGVCAGSKKTTCGGAIGWLACGASNYGADYETSETKCDSLDNDCDGQTDEGVKTTFYQDADADTYGNSAVTTQACSAPGGYVSDSTDCDDTVAVTHPGAPDTICDGVDNDCDQVADDDYTPDNNCFLPGVCSEGNSASTCVSGVETACATGLPTGTDDDCNGIDEDCSGAADNAYTPTETECGEGYCHSTGLLTCEQGQTVDTCKPEGPVTFYQDLDGDYYGDTQVSQTSCTDLQGYVTVDSDCDDTNADVNPDVTEVCDGIIDDNCDGSIDEGCECTNGQTQQCGYNDVGTCQYGTQECTDGQWNECIGAVLPEGESCDGLDNDCDESVDEDLTRADENTNGLCADNMEYCSAGLWLNNELNYLPQEEIPYDNIDQDCSGADLINVDGDGYAYTLDCDDNNAEIWQYLEGYSDYDGDGYGAQFRIESLGNSVCSGESLPEGYADNSNDCDDEDSAINPDAIETCDNTDNNCDGSTDEDLTQPAGNIFGSCAENTQYCEAGQWYDNEGNYVPIDEVCDGLDNNCDNSIDEGVTITFYKDADNDGYYSESVQACESPDETYVVATNGIDNCPSVENTDQLDTDDDSLGDVCDTYPYMTGDSADVTTNIEGGVSVDAGDATGIQTVKINDGAGNTIVEFEWDFNTVLDLTKITVNTDSPAGTGSVQVNGLILPDGVTKAVYVNKLTTSNAVCIKDVDNALVSEISSGCNGADEVQLSCPGTTTTATNTYTCTVEGDRYKITGLTHSAVEEYTIVITTPPATGNGGSSGGGHSGGSSNCAYSCAAWGACVNGKQTRTCTPNIYCDGSSNNKALTERTCETVSSSGKTEETTLTENTANEQGNQPTQETVDQNGNGITGAAVTEPSGFGAHPLLSGLAVLALMGGLGVFVYLKFLKP